MSLDPNLNTGSSPAVGDFYRTGIEIWTGFELVGITEKKIGPIMSNFETSFFKFSWVKK